MSVYEPLTRHLESRREAEAPLTFEEIEAILNRDLPRSARQYQPWWSNTATHTQADAWLSIGWKTTQLDLVKQRVVFVRDRDASMLGVRESGSPYLRPDLEGAVMVQANVLSPIAKALVQRHMSEQAVSAEQAIADLLHQAAMDRRRRLLDRFPLVGAPSSVDSVDLIREDRDAR